MRPPRTPRNEIADGDASVQAEQLRENRLPRCSLVGGDGHARGRIDPRRQHTELVFVRIEVPLQSVKERLGEGEWRHRGANALADGQGGVELPFGPGDYDETIEPPRKIRIFPDSATEIPRILVGETVDVETLGDVIPVEIVEAITFELGAHIALVPVPSVVGVSTPLPAV